MGVARGWEQLVAARIWDGLLPVDGLVRGQTGEIKELRDSWRVERIIAKDGRSPKQNVRALYLLTRRRRSSTSRTFGFLAPPTRE